MKDLSPSMWNQPIQLNISKRQHQIRYKARGVIECRELGDVDEWIEREIAEREEFDDLLREEIVQEEEVKNIFLLFQPFLIFFFPKYDSEFVESDDEEDINSEASYEDGVSKVIRRSSRSIHNFNKKRRDWSCRWSLVLCWNHEMVTVR